MQSRWTETESGRSSPSSPTPFLPVEQFVARGGPSVRDSLITTESLSSSLYPETFEDEQDNLPRIASFQDTPLSASFDADNVAFRLDLLVNNHYFLPPTHAKPSAIELASISAKASPPQPKKSPMLSPANFRDLFRKAPVRNTPPPGSNSTPGSAAVPHVQPPPPPRIAVLREQLVDLQQAVRDAEREQRRVRAPPPASLPSLDDIDPTNEVDLRPDTIVPDLTPSAPPILPEDESYRRDLLEKAVELSFSTNGSTPTPTPQKPVPTERRSAEEKGRRRHRSSSPHKRRPRTADTPPVPIAGPSSDTRSIRSLNSRSPVSPAAAALIGSPIISEQSYFSLPRSQSTAPTPSRAVDFPVHESPLSDTRTPPVPAPNDARRLKILGQPIDTFMDDMHERDMYGGESTSPHTPLSPPPPRKPMRDRKGSKTSSHVRSSSGQTLSSSVDVGDTTITLGQAPTFVVQLDDTSRTPLTTIPSVVSLPQSITSASLYSDPEEVPDTGPPGLAGYRQKGGPSLLRRLVDPGPFETTTARSSLDVRNRMVRTPSFESSRPSLALSMNPARPSFDSTHSDMQSMDATTALYDRTSPTGRPSLDAAASTRPSMTISLGGHTESVRSLHSDAFGDPRHRTSYAPSRARSRSHSRMRHHDDVASIRSTRSATTATGDNASIRSGRGAADTLSVRSAYSEGSYGGSTTTPAPVSPIQAQSVPAPDIAGPGFFDEVQERYLRSTESFHSRRAQRSIVDSDSSETDPQDEEVVHLGASSRTASPMPGTSALYPHNTSASSLGMSRMQHYEPISSMPDPPRVRPRTKSKDKGLVMLQRAQAGSAGNLHGPPPSPAVPLFTPQPSASEDGHDFRPRTTVGPTRDVADKRLEGLLVQHMEQERDRLKRIASGAQAQAHPA